MLTLASLTLDEVGTQEMKLEPLPHTYTQLPVYKYWSQMSKT